MSLRPMRNMIWIVGAVAVLAYAQPAASDATKVRADRSFGDGKGWVTTKIPHSMAIAYDATVLRNGKIVVAGQAAPKSGTAQIVVARYRTDGRLDRGFARRGIFKSALPAKKGPFIATAVVQQQSTHRLVVAGGYGQGSMLALRLLPDGRLDRSFGKGRSGRTVVPVGGIANSVAIQSGGRILLGGSNANLNGRPMVVARLTSGGKLDSSFASGGIAQSLFWDPDLASSAGVFGLAAAPDGGIVASGHIDYIGSDGHGSTGVFRLDSSGQAVQDFGAAGHVEIDFPQPSGRPAFWFPCAMVTDDLGRITVTGDGTTEAGAVLLTARLTASGIPDSSFGSSGDGRAITPGPNKGDFTTCGAAPTANGSVTVGAGPVLAQLTSDGAASEAFATGGRLEIDQPRHLEIDAVARSGRRRVIVAGTAGPDIYVARYLLASRR
jgi:uncharacterized delta-60 repeat protein